MQHAGQCIIQVKGGANVCSQKAAALTTSQYNVKTDTDMTSLTKKRAGPHTRRHARQLPSPHLDIEERQLSARVQVCQ